MSLLLARSISLASTFKHFLAVTGSLDYVSRLTNRPVLRAVRIRSRLRVQQVPHPRPAHLHIRASHRRITSRYRCRGSRCHTPLHPPPHQSQSQEDHFQVQVQGKQVPYNRPAHLHIKASHWRITFSRNQENYEN
jgi:hypothetical protein